MTNETTYTKTILNDKNPQCVILDMDSTLSSPEGENWEDMVNHKPIQPVLDLAVMLHQHGYDLVISTARPEGYRDETEAWLQRYLPQYAALYMRDDTVEATAAEMKEAALKDIDEVWKVFIAIDDSPWNAKVYNDNGVHCLRLMTNESYWAAHGDH